MKSNMCRLCMAALLLSGYRGSALPAGEPEDPVTVGTRLQLFVDDLVVDRLDNADFRLHHPVKQPLPKSPLAGSYMTVIKDGDLYRGYYRGLDREYKGKKYSGHPGEIVCYAESRDGREWTFPDLGLFEVGGSRANNVILREPPFCHNFSPFKDTNPDCDPDARYKALGGHPGYNRNVEAEGLYYFASPDGIHWRKMGDEAVIPYNMSWKHAFDSQNVSFWSEAEGQYVCYFRRWMPHGEVRPPVDVSRRRASDHGGAGHLRTIGRTTSPDFLHWSDSVLTYANMPGEHLYTSQTHPYYREPSIYIALPTRYMAGKVGAEKTRAMLGSTDILLMTARAGSPGFERLFPEAIIRPGLNPKRWGNRANYVALNIVPTGPQEMSIYHRSGHRYTLRPDGFVSIHTGYEQGELLTRPLLFDGQTLVLNFSTSAAGQLRVELQTADGQPVPGFSLEDCQPIVGDDIERVVNWKGDPDLAALHGQPVRLRFVMNECDLYSFRLR